MSHWRTRVAPDGPWSALTGVAPARAGGGGDPGASTGSGAGAAARRAAACSRTAAGSLMARLMGTVTVGLPAKRSRLRTSTSAARTTTSAEEICSSVSGFAPAAPWVSTAMLCPASLAASSRDSAAMYVCAMPVGHDVTATIFISPTPPCRPGRRWPGGLRLPGALPEICGAPDGERAWTGSSCGPSRRLRARR